MRMLRHTLQNVLSRGSPGYSCEDKDTTLWRCLSEAEENVNLLAELAYNVRLLCAFEYSTAYFGFLSTNVH